MRGRLLTVLSGEPDGSPAWIRALADGDDAGWFEVAGILRRDERVDEVVRFLRRVPFTGLMRPAYAVLFRGAVASIPHPYRRLLGLRRSPFPVITGTRMILAVAARTLGSGPRAQDFARERLERLRAASTSR